MIKAINSIHCLLHHSWTLRATSVPWTLHKSLLAKNVSCFLQCCFPPGFPSVISPVPYTLLLYKFIHLFLPPFQHLLSFGLIAGSFLLPEICQVLHEQMPSCTRQNNDMNNQTSQQRSYLVSMRVGSTIMIIIKSITVHAFILQLILNNCNLVSFKCLQLSTDHLSNTVCSITSDSRYSRMFNDDVSAYVLSWLIFTRPNCTILCTTHYLYSFINTTIEICTLCQCQGGCFISPVQKCWGQTYEQCPKKNRFCKALSGRQFGLFHAEMYSLRVSRAAKDSVKQ